jgi:tetratricopeptide (TPR) repeat protein
MAVACEDGEDPGRLGWPVADGSTLVGWLTHADLVLALQEGRRDERVAAIAQAAPAWDATSASPWLHADESLDQALRRMAEAGFDCLPVVGRREPPELLGVVTVNEVVRAYRRTAAGDSLPARAGSRSPKAFLLRLAIVAALVLAVSGLLAQRVRTGRAESARRAFDAGRALAAQQRYQEAIEQFRRALAVLGSSDVRIALAEAQLAADRLSEAALYFNSALRSDPTSGPALLGLARIADRQHLLDDAVLAYGRAVVANWPEGTDRQRLRTRLEFADYLARRGLTDRALAQLLETEGQAEGETAVLLDVAARFLALGSATEARDLYAAVVRAEADAIEAHRGRGEAELALGNWSAARDAFGQVLRLDPQDERAHARNTLCSDLLALDPRLRRLSSSERQRRSRALLAAVLAEFDACASGAGADPGLAVIRPAVDTARQLVGAARRRVAPGDAAEDNLDLAVQIWSSTRAACPAEGDASVVELLMRRLAA